MMFYNRECLKMLKRFLMSLNEAMVMLSSLRAVYKEYLVKPVPPYRMKSVSCEGTLTGCITEARMCVHVCELCVIDLLEMTTSVL